MSIPSTAKRKAIRRYPWDATDLVDVHLDRIDRGDEALYEVYLEDGTHLGGIESKQASIDRVVRMIRHPGKTRTFWHVVLDGQELYRQRLESQAEAIRFLLEEHEAARRLQG